MLRAQALREETAVDSISPERAGSIMYDTLAYINQMQLQDANPLLISKIYASVAAMEADSAPVSDLTGQPLRPGQVVVIATGDPDDPDEGVVYRYDGTEGGASSWTAVGKIGYDPYVDGYLYAGVAHPDDAAVTPGAKVFFIASEAGTYTNKDGLVVNDGEVAMLKYNGSWSKEKVGLVSAETGLEYSPNLIDPAQMILNKYYYNGVYQYNPIYDSTPFLSVKPSTTYTFSIYGRFVTIFDEDGNISRTLENVYTPITTAANETGVIITFEKRADYFLEEGEGVEYQPYFPPRIKILDGQISMQKLAGDVKESFVCRNLLDKSAADIGYYFMDVKAYSATYNCSAPIPCSPGQTFCVSNDGAAYAPRFVAYLANVDDEAAVSYEDYQSVFTIPAGAHFFVVTFLAAAWTAPLQIEAGSTPTAYQAYFASYEQLKLRDKQVTKSKLADDVVFYSPNFKRLHQRDSSVAVGNSVSVGACNVSKNFALAAIIRGTIQSCLVGVAYLGFYGKWFEITPTEIIVHSGTEGSVDTTLTHGLTLGAVTKFVVDRNLGNAKITLFNNAGEFYSAEVAWGVKAGGYFARNANTSGNLDIDLSLLPKDINERIWMFGDSYFSYEDPARWVYYLIAAGYVSNLINAVGGESSPAALNDFDALIATGAIPTYALWALGMNDGSDAAAAPNSTWLAKTQAFIATCEGKGIEPILCTIPSVPSVDNSKKSAWVRASGHRYIDLAAAVEAEGTTTWIGWGTDKAMLSGDQVHPSEYGAKALWGVVITEFPEVAVTEV